MKTIYQLFVFAVIVLFCSSCLTIVRPGQIGVRQRFGKIRGNTLQPGAHFYNFFVARILKLSTRTTNMPVEMETLPTKEGLNVMAEFAILYKLKPEYAKVIVETIGTQFESTIILSVLKSAAPNITAKYYAKDLYTSERASIGREIADEMARIIGDRGIVIEAVLMKSIRLPQGLAKSIEAKLESEQEAQRMEFVLNRERKEAERKVIEAGGIKQSQIIIAEGLSPLIIQFKSIEAFTKLADSNNSKIIISNGKTPFLINSGEDMGK